MALQRQGDRTDTPPSLSRDELGSLYNPGSKKQNLSHLLNFQFSPRGGGVGRGRAGGGGRRGRDSQPTQHYTPPKPRYNTAQYLQANCQFIMRSGGQYEKHMEDPDALVDWDLVEQLILKQSGSEPTACPICLFPPTAAKISRCGHVYCWPCILHYLALSDDESRKCPICDQAIARQDLRSVLVLPQTNFTTGSTVEMRLMKRERDSLVAVPADCKDCFTDLPSVEMAGTNRRFIKMFQASVEEVDANILQRERMELETQWKEEKHTPESVFIQEALTLLNGRHEAGLMQCRPVSQAVHCRQEEELPQLEEVSVAMGQIVLDPFGEDEQKKEEEPKNMFGLSGVEEMGENRGRERPRYASGESGSSEGEVEGEEGETTITLADLDISTVGGRSAQERRQTFYFYQASDGQPVFLHALNVQMLVTQFGSLENCPCTIRAEILEKDTSCMTSDLRDRLRYLRHLPVASSFEVAELDISLLVSEETKAAFKGQLEERRRRRLRKLREERRREKRIDLEERRLMGRYPSPMARIESQYHYPEVGHQQVSETAEFPTMVLESEATRTDVADTGGAVSFASAAKHRPVQTQPSIPRSASSPATGWTVLGPNMTLPVRNTSAHSDSEHETEGWEPPPQPTSLGDALAAALAVAPTAGGGKKKGKRGKGGKGVLLCGGPPRPVL